MTTLMRAAALCVLIGLPAAAPAQPGGVADPGRGTRELGDVDAEPGQPAPEDDVGDRPTRRTPPDPDDATRHAPDTHGGSMPPTQHTGPTHPPGAGGARQKDAP